MMIPIGCCPSRLPTLPSPTSPVLSTVASKVKLLDPVMWIPATPLSYSCTPLQPDDKNHEFLDTCNGVGQCCHMRTPKTCVTRTSIWQQVLRRSDS